MTDPDPMTPAKRRCTATSRSGNRCGLAPIPGGNVCHWHGGAAPQVQAAARMRITAMVEPALARLGRILLTGEDQVAMRAVENVLDRSGLVRGGQPDEDEARALLAEYLLDLRDVDNESGDEP